MSLSLPNSGLGCLDRCVLGGDPGVVSSLHSALGHADSLLREQPAGALGLHTANNGVGVEGHADRMAGGNRPGRILTTLATGVGARTQANRQCKRGVTWLILVSARSRNSEG